MASKITIFLAIFLLLNIISCNLVNACEDHDDKPKPPKPSPRPQTPKPAPVPKAPKPAPVPKAPKLAPKPESPKPAPKPESPKPAPKPESPKPAPKPESPKPAPSPKAYCPKNTLQVKLCANVLNIIKIGPSEECCSLIAGLVDAEAAVCLCTAIKANVLNLIHLIVPVDLTLFLNQCGRSCTEKYLCA